jgi:hypothetical protein
MHYSKREDKQRTLLAVQAQVSGDAKLCVDFYFRRQPPVETLNPNPAPAASARRRTPGGLSSFRKSTPSIWNRR